MKVQVLILVLLVPSWLDAEQQYYGTRIASLTLSGAESQADLPLLPIRSGEIITAENIRLSIQALYNTGHYSYVEVDATPAANGETNLDFRVRSNFFFSTIRLEPENILERPLSGYFRLPYGEKFTTSTVDALVRETAEMLKAEGYFEATITPKNQLDEATHLAFVTLSVTPGNKARVGIVRVQGGLQTFSQKELLDAFKDYSYPNEIGPGVYDIHSPRVPETHEMTDLLKLARLRLSDAQLWINPDCGLKTRKWEEVRPALVNMVAAARELRASA